MKKEPCFHNSREIKQMCKIIFVSGPCGCGKSTFSVAYARHLVEQGHRTVYIIHGDDFQDGFIQPEDKPDFSVNGQPSDRVLWEDILRFNWDCIISTADRALQQDLDVVIDYIIEDEMPRVLELAEKYGASLYYIVLTADEDELEKRILSRGDTNLIERSKFLKQKLESMKENQGHLYNSTGKSIVEMCREIVLEQYAVPLKK